MYAERTNVCAGRTSTCAGRIHCSSVTTAPCWTRLGTLQRGISVYWCGLFCILPGASRRCGALLLAAKPVLDRKAEDKLKRDVLALYRDLTLLQNFAIVNYTAVVKVWCGMSFPPARSRCY